MCGEEEREGGREGALHFEKERRRVEDRVYVCVRVCVCLCIVLIGQRTEGAHSGGCAGEEEEEARSVVWHDDVSRHN
jgi:hypothetical protein